MIENILLEDAFKRVLKYQKSVWDSKKLSDKTLNEIKIILKLFLSKDEWWANEFIEEIQRILPGTKKIHIRYLVRILILAGVIMAIKIGKIKYKYKK